MKPLVTRMLTGNGRDQCQEYAMPFNFVGANARACMRVNNFETFESCGTWRGHRSSSLHDSQSGQYIAKNAATLTKMLQQFPSTDRTRALFTVQETPREFRYHFNIIPPLVRES